MIADTLKQLVADAAGVAPEDVALEHPADLLHGDYSSNVAMALAKERGVNPRELAEEIADKIDANKIPEIESVEVAGPGFINIRLSRQFFAAATKGILLAAEAWGSNEYLKGKKVMVEYTQPNPFKEFHIGHLMSNAVGESLSRLVEFSGAETKRANYQGDVGIHVASAIWGLQKLGGSAEDVAVLGKAYAKGARAYKEDDEAKQEIIAINKHLYARDDETLNDLYDKGRNTSLEHFEVLYRKLGTTFDYYFFESDTGPVGEKLVRANPDVFETSDGAIVYRGERYGLHTRVFINSEGLPTYEAKELGLLKMKADTWPFDISITETAKEVDEYFKVVTRAMGEVMPDLAGKVHHVSHGMMRLPTGKMSSRTGDVVTGESLLEGLEGMVRDKIHERGFEKQEALELEQAVAVAAVKYTVLRQSTGRDIIFDPEKSLSFEGDSGPYLQYAHTRAASVLEKAASQSASADTNAVPAETAVLERLLYRFPEVVERAAREYEPHHVTTYLTELAGTFNSWYAGEQILDDSPGQPYKLAITKAFTTTMKNGLWLLGIRAPQKM